MRALVERDSTTYRWRGEDGRLDSGFCIPEEAAVAAYHAGAGLVADLDYIQAVRAEQAKLLEQGSEAEVGFDFEGVFVYDPAMDSSGRSPVDPVREYGEAFLESRFLTITAIPPSRNTHV